jgi:hypothetical protein
MRKIEVSFKEVSLSLINKVSYFKIHVDENASREPEALPNVKRGRLMAVRPRLIDGSKLSSRGQYRQ